MLRKFFVYFIAIVSFINMCGAKELLIEDKGSYLYIKNLPEESYKPHKHYQRKKKYKKKYINYFIAKRNGKIFHKADCKFAKRIKKKIKFKTKAEAIKKGYRPCKVCKP